MNQFNYDIISQYLAGELVGEELLDFEKELQTNTALANEVALYKTIDRELSFLQNNKTEKENLTLTLNNLSQQHFKKNEAKVVAINKRWWYAAAAVAATVILFFVLRPSKNIEPFNNETLYASYVNKDIDELTSTQRGNNDSVLIRAASFYNHKNYTAALPLLEGAIADHPAEKQLGLAIGICYLQTNQYDFALRFFDELANGKTVYKNQAVWYKALVYLKQNKLSDCSTALLAIPESDNHFKDAQELLKKINRKEK